MSIPIQFPISTSFAILKKVLVREAQKSTVTAATPNRVVDTSFRFFDLSPELRNMVYRFVLEDNAPLLLSVFTANEHVPSCVLTVITKQIRSETVGLYLGAVRSFWDTHIFEITTGFGQRDHTSAGYRITSSPPLNEMLDKVAASTFNPRLRKLQVFHRLDSGAPVRMDLEMTSPSIVVQISFWQLPHVHQVGWWLDLPKTAIQLHNVDCYDTSCPGYIDVYNVLRAFSLVQGGSICTKQLWVTSRAELRSDRREIRGDRRELHGDHREVRSDRRDRRLDVRDYRRDRRDARRD